MSNKLIGYDNQLWRVEQEFFYTGTDQPFTLEPGTYLFICEGAHGGKGSRDIKEYGGITYGEITLNETTTFHAVVGSDGADYNIDYALCTGGFNGGAHGGMSYSSTYSHGPGGGGATDIRLLPYDPTEYPTYSDDGSIIFPTSETLIDVDDNTYTQLEYIYAIGSNNSGYFNTEYIPKSNTKIETEVVCFENTIQAYEILFGAKNYSYQNNAFVFFSRFNNNNIPVYNRSGAETQGADFLYNEKIKLICYQDKAEWFFDDSETPNGSVISTGIVNDCICPLLINTANNASNNSLSSEGSWDKFKLYSFKISEIDTETGDETVIKNYVPAYRNADHKEGLFDIINHVFITSNIGTWLQGPPKTNHPSLNSRIMVAAGGGGGCHQIETGNWNDGCSYGGGPYGSVSPGYSTGPDGFCDLYPSQTDGYAFGYGCHPVKRTSSNNYSAEGCGGGGGGWYSGYASIPHNQNATNMTKQGGGGSSYVLTASSYKPDGYDPDSKYYFTKVLLHGGQAMGDLFSNNPLDWNNGHVYICKLEENIKTGDIIVYPCTGNLVSHDLPAGKYKLKVWGGDGGSRARTSHCVKGGYSEGMINTQNDHEIYVYTGGSGGPRADIGYSDTFANAMAIANLPSLKFNGGKSMQNRTRIISSSGGGTDIRFDVDDLYHRVIVAGGAGSEGMVGGYGGVGGGETGGQPATTNQGNNSGPGTQSTGYAFGEGEASVGYSSAYPGSGGGGWYGGYATVRTSNYDWQRGGAGGSGFTLTANTPITDIPSGYACNEEEYYLTETTTVQGGNDLPIWHTKTQIEAISVLAKCICRDEYGYKYYDKENDTWVLLENQSIDITTFETYGSSFTSDNGLSDNYKIISYAENDDVNAIQLYVIPYAQTITIDIPETLSVINCDIDDVYDTESFDRYYNITHDDEKTTIELTVDHLTNNQKRYKAYLLQLDTANQSTGNTYVKLDEHGRRIFKHYYFDIDNQDKLIVEERTMELKDPEDYRGEDGSIQTAQWLLPVGSKLDVPSEYYDGLVDGDAKNLTNFTMCEYDRTLYVAYVSESTIESGPFVKINAMNLIDHTVHGIHKFTLSQVYPRENYASRAYLGPMLIDEKYFYFNQSQAYNNNANYNQCLTRINKETFEVSITAACGNESFIAYGQMTWWDDHTIICFGQKSILLYNTIINTWTKYPHTINGTSTTTVTDWAIGNTQIIAVGTNGSNKNVCVIDKDTFALLNTFQLTKADTAPCICYDGNHLFYIVTRYYIYAYDEETSEIVKTINIGTMAYPESVRYCNGAVMISQYYNAADLFIYRTDFKQYDAAGNEIPMFTSIYLPWTHYSNKTYGSCYLPYVVNDVYYYGHTSLLTIPYSAYAKYKFGPRTDKHMVVLNLSNIEQIHYDERFVSLSSSNIQVHEGYLQYTFSASLMEHVYVTETISKSDYRYFLNKSELILKEG